MRDFACTLAAAALLAGCGGNPPLGTGQEPSAAAGAGAAGAGAGAAGAAGAAPMSSCDIMPIVAKYSCALAGACHGAMGAAGLSLASSADLESLFGRQSLGGGVGPTASKCGGQGRFYIVPGSFPATGLLLQKLTANPPCGAQMPDIGGPLTAAELACFQQWADWGTQSRAGLTP